MSQEDSKQVEYGMELKLEDGLTHPPRVPTLCRSVSGTTAAEAAHPFAFGAKGWGPRTSNLSRMVAPDTLPCRHFGSARKPQQWQSLDPSYSYKKYI